MDNNEKLTGYKNIDFPEVENALLAKRCIDNHEYIKFMQEKMADIRSKQPSHIIQSLIQSFFINVFGVAAFLIFINIPYYIAKNRYKKAELLYGIGTKLLAVGYISLALSVIAFIAAAVILYIKFYI